MAVFDPTVRTPGAGVELRGLKVNEFVPPVNELVMLIGTLTNFIEETAPETPGTVVPVRTWLWGAVVTYPAVANVD